MQFIKNQSIGEPGDSRGDNESHSQPTISSIATCPETLLFDLGCQTEEQLVKQSSGDGDQSYVRSNELSQKAGSRAMMGAVFTNTFLGLLAWTRRGPAEGQEHQYTYAFERSIV